MQTTLTRTTSLFHRGSTALGLATLLLLLSLPFTTAFADNDRRGRGPDFSAGSDVPGWRLGGRWDSGGYQIFRKDRGRWIRVPGSGIYLYGNRRNPLILNSQNEVYRWNGRRWRFVGRENRRGFNRQFNNPPGFRRDQRRDYYRDERRRYDGFRDGRRDNGFPGYDQRDRRDRGRIGRRNDGRSDRNDGRRFDGDDDRRRGGNRQNRQ